MADFRARILAELDDTQIPSQIRDIEKKNTFNLNNIQVETRTIINQIQSALDNHTFNLNIGINNQSKNIWQHTQRSIADDFDDMTSKIGNGKIQSLISSVNASYKKLESTGHQSLSTIKDDLTEIERLQGIFGDDRRGIFERISAYKDYEQILERVKNTESTVRYETRSFVDADKVAKLDDKMELWLNKNTKAAKTFGDQIRVLQNRLENLDPSSEDAADALNRIEQEFRQIDVQAELAGKKGRSFASTFKNAFESLLRYVSLAEIIHEAINGLRQMAQNVYDIDTAMTSLRKVTDETAERYEAFLDSSAKSAKELGRSISSLVEQTAEWSKLGYSLDESEELAKISSIYANVADIDNATAVSDMVTAMKANLCLNSQKWLYRIYLIAGNT